MLKSLFTITLVAALAGGIGYADQSAGVSVLPTPRTPANSGKQMYASYCASCHGVDGKGAGPVAPALKDRPTDLSALARNNGGKFPEEHVISVLEFGSEASAHGTVSMPVWGPILGRMDVNSPQAASRVLRISNITKFVESLQVK